MGDLSRRLRKANPHEGQPLPEHAVKTLDDLLTGRRTPQWDRSARSVSPRRVWRPLVLAGSGFAAAVTVVAVIALVILRPVPAVAITPDRLPLEPTSWTVETLLEESMTGVPAPEVAESRRGAEWEGWFVQLDLDSPTATFIQPQRTQIEWNDDLSGTSRVIAGVPMSADGSPIEPVPASAEATGTILYEDSWAPGELVTPFPTAPPDDVDGMRAYLQAFLREQGGTDADAPSAGDYVLAVTSLMQVWTLSEAAQRAAITVVLDAAGVTVAGETTDRAGRSGVVLNTEPTDLQPDYRTRLIIDPASWRILAAETNTIDGLPDFGIPAGAVTDYTIWR